MEITNYDEQPIGSYAIAIFDLDLRPKYNFRLKRLKLTKSKKGNLFIGFPSYKKGEENGKIVWDQFFDFTDEQERKEINQAVLDLAKNFLNEPIPF